MNTHDYQREAMRTNNPNGTGLYIIPTQEDMAIIAPALKLSSEAGEICGDLGKWLMQGHAKPTPETLALELGDLIWHACQLAENMGFSLEQVLQMNLDKLAKRYNGEFSPEKSLSRSEEVLG